jgi:hypothetical protein
MTRVAVVGDRVPDLELMGVKSTKRPSSPYEPTPYGPAEIASIGQVFLLEDGRAGIRAQCRNSSAEMSEVTAFCLVGERGIVPVALHKSEKAYHLEGAVQVKPARSPLNLVRGVDAVCDGMTASGEFLLYKEGRSTMLAAAPGKSRIIASVGEGPGLPANITISRFGAPLVSGDHVLIPAVLAGPGLQNPAALYLASDQGLELLGRFPLGPSNVGPGGHVCIAKDNRLFAGIPGALVPVQTSDGTALLPAKVKAPVQVMADGSFMLEVEEQRSIPDGLGIPGGIKGFAGGIWQGPPERLMHVSISQETLGWSTDELHAQGLGLNWKSALGFLAVSGVPSSRGPQPLLAVTSHAQ